jgi:DNA-binding response OmpR family regulator
MRASTSKVPVLVLSAHPEEQYALRALKGGAAGYLTKESVPQELLPCGAEGLQRRLVHHADFSGTNLLLKLSRRVGPRMNRYRTANTRSCS